MERNEPTHLSQILAEVLAGDGLSLAEAAKLIPCGKGKRTAPSTLWRWSKAGIRLADGAKVYLETARVAGRYVTSRAALGRFLARQNEDEPAGQGHPPCPPARTPAKRRRAVEAALDDLAARGV